MRINFESQTTFEERAGQIEQELARVEEDLTTCPPEQVRRLKALRASLQRSLRWYRARGGGRGNVKALGPAASVEEIRA